MLQKLEKIATTVGELKELLRPIPNDYILDSAGYFYSVSLDDKNHFISLERCAPNKDFISQIAFYVKKYAKKYGILVYSPIIAQAILESGKGTSELAVNANNFFGIKYKPGRCPTANGIYYKVGSEQNPDGSYVSSSMRWCKFDSMEQCVIGYFDFINISRYSNLKGITNPRIYIENIKADGYATSLKYVTNIMYIIDCYGLEKYDEIEHIENAFSPYVIRIAVPSLAVKTGPGKKYITMLEVKQGSAYTIVEEYDGWGKLKSGAGWIELSCTERK